MWWAKEYRHSLISPSSAGKMAFGLEPSTLCGLRGGLSKLFGSLFSHLVGLTDDKARVEEQRGVFLLFSFLSRQTQEVEMSLLRGLSNP